ncbi:L-type lectin-domain containing receptor kinase IV.3 [Hibiscus syriacus]|uniref:non-specific serine/threonine protein kinase n=1 Tax=Hibiscus syriacus TaxID=106335 RepID=A0A6A2ZK79_HIBSY|nr:L-type lectin-domain containing receptor kinase IV.3 [Hibiscus syriacus]
MLIFIYNGFRSANLSLDGIAQFTPNGLPKLTNATHQQKGHTFYPHSVNFKNSIKGSVSSFSSTFVFAITSEYPTIRGHGIAFVISPTMGLPGALPSQYIGLFNGSNNGDASNHVVAVELVAIQSREFDDINENHVGVDNNGLRSIASTPAGYYEDGSRRLRNLSLISGKRIQVWVEYHGLEKRMDITLAPFKVSKPKNPLLSLHLDLSSIVNDETRKMKFAEVVEDWELEYGPSRFKFKDLYIDTKGFKDKELLCAGGFGRVYRGVLPTGKLEVAVKRVYDHMPVGSLDKYLYDQPKVTLDWAQRFGIIKGVASGLFYLHEEWEQVVIQRDVKASNVLLDSEFNRRLGDFGLARLCDHGTEPQTTHVVGSLGYMAPEHTQPGKRHPASMCLLSGHFCSKLPAEEGQYLSFQHKISFW